LWRDAQFELTVSTEAVTPAMTGAAAFSFAIGRIAQEEATGEPRAFDKRYRNGNYHCPFARRTGRVRDEQ
jgi:hypothetical protein